MRVPYRKGGFFYYSRTEEGRQYPIYCRRAGSLEAPEAVTLDLNVLAEGRPFMDLGAYTVSDDGKLLAFSTDEVGFRQYTLQVKDLATGELLPLRVEKVVSVAWAADNQTLFYVVEEEKTKRPHRLLSPSPRQRGARSRVRGGGRGLQHRRGTDAEPPLPGPGHRQPHHFRGPLPARGRPRRPVDGRGPPRPRAGVRPRASRRSILDPHERHGPELPRGGGARRLARPRELAGGDPASAGRDAGGNRPLPAPRGGVRARGRPAPGPDHGPAHERVAPPGLPGAGVFRVSGGEPRVRHHGLPLRLPVARDPQLGLRLRHGRAHEHAPQANGGARRIRPRAVRDGAAVRDRTGRRQDPAVRGLPERDEAGRRGSPLSLRLRRLRDLPARRVLLEPAEPPRPRLRRSCSPTCAAGASSARPGTTTGA